MNVWNYIGEFILFRWLIGNRNRTHSADSTYNADTTDYSYRRYNADDNFSTNNHHQTSRSSYSGADIYDDEDDALDDFDPTDSDNSQFNDFTKTYDYHEHGNSRFYDDFHDEQDDYDMMDDDF